MTRMQDQISQSAKNRNISINIDLELVDETVFHIINLLHPLVTGQFDIAQQNSLIEGLKELQFSETEQEEFMSEEYKAILENELTIKKEFNLQPRMLNYLWGVIADLYVDTAKIKGFHNVQQKMPILKSILNSYNYNDLI